LRLLTNRVRPLPLAAVAAMGLDPAARLAEANRRFAWYIAHSADPDQPFRPIVITDFQCSPPVHWNDYELSDGIPKF
jgi:hypothetical protein